MTDRLVRNDDPFRLNLEQQKKRAKDLLRDLKANRPDALSRLHKHHPKGHAKSSRPDSGELKLADSQLIIARELGLTSWPDLKSHIAAMQRESRAIADTAAEAPDAGMKTLHIRCGADIRPTLQNAGFAGAFLEYSNPFCQGPVVREPELLAARAEFLARAYGGHEQLSQTELKRRLSSEEAALSRTANDFTRAVLWMEHDSYDQLILVRCLARLAETGLPDRLELISVNQFPGNTRFLGLGQLPEEAVRLLWSRRRQVTGPQLEQARQTWRALISADPRGLLRMSKEAGSPLPDLPGALQRHLQELPSVENGLGLTERLVLEMLSEEPRTVGQLFHLLMTEREPLPWLGDLMFFHVIAEMSVSAEPVFEPSSTDLPVPKRTLTLTETGRTVLAGKRDWLSLKPPERWVGGVRITRGQPCWRWDENNKRTVLV